MSKLIHYGEHQPNCNGTGTLRARLTTNPDAVTCKRCLKALQGAQRRREFRASVGEAS